MIQLPSDQPVVLVDDTEADRFIMSIVLEKSNLRNDVVCLDGGNAAIDHIDAVASGQHPRPALMLIDVNMPGITGFDVLAYVRSQDEFQHLPVIAMLTSSDADEDIRRAEALGADDYLPKQSGLDDFVGLVNERFVNVETCDA